jgi:hypothetical protein
VSFFDQISDGKMTSAPRLNLPEIPHILGFIGIHYLRDSPPEGPCHYGIDFGDLPNCNDPYVEHGLIFLPRHIESRCISETLAVVGKSLRVVHLL